jgi:hypothetical protein
MMAMSSRSSGQRPPSARDVERELADLRERDAAAHDDAALVAYQGKWQRRLCRLQQSFPERWRVVGLSDEEVRDFLTLRLLEAVREPTPLDRLLARPGKEWGLLIARRELAALRKAFRIRVVAGDPADTGAYPHAPTQEERWLADEADQLLVVAQARAEAQLSRPQRSWLAALKLSARGGGMVESSAEPNLSAAARLLGKNRSSAQRSYRELQARFGRELSRLK